MNKRQRKKKEKKYLPIIADEFNLLSMNPTELEKAHSDFREFREKYAYRKKYKNLKEGQVLKYFYPIGSEFTNSLEKFSKIGSSKKMI
ncbi:hypothetical protein BTS2_3328 [Bacillus sp. TS-2]|nr:hypothetical protein BTS2_3328 [Bacillus sp. TS-2]